MTHDYLRWAAAGLAFVPATAWAHGDHHGLRGVVHIMTEPAHLGLLLAGGIVAAALALGARRLVARHQVESQAKARVRTD
jgi:hypothetical protein